MIYYFDVFDATNGYHIGNCQVSGYSSGNVFYSDPGDWLELLDSYIGQNVIIRPAKNNPPGLKCHGIDEKSGLVLAENDGAKDFPMPSVLDAYIERMQ